MRRKLILGGLAVALGAAVLYAIDRLWLLPSLSSLFGEDLVAYQAAAQRLAATGSPYHPTLLAGPVANVTDNIPIGYFYPPPLAQLFTVVADWPLQPLAMAWSGAQFVALIGAMWLLLRAGASPVRPEAMLAVGLAAVTYVPLQFALFAGNVSGWLTIGVALLLAGGLRTKGAVASALTLIKLTPLPFLVSAVVDPHVRRNAIAVFGGALVSSVVLAPAAWVAWISILPNVAGNPISQVANFSPARVLASVGLPLLGTIIGWSLAIGFGAASLLLAARHGFGLQSIAAATLAVTLASPTLWDHYLAVFLPLIVYAWNRVDGRGRLVFFGYLVVSLGLWYGYGGWLPYNALILVLLVGVTIVIVAVPDGAATEEPATGIQPSTVQPVAHGA